MTSAPKRLVLASNNAKKLAELQVLFAPVALELMAQNAFGIAEADEPHATFIENALTKARHAARAAGAAAIADDSGLCVDALGGAPGVQSAVFAAVAPSAADRESRRLLQDAANNRLLLDRLDGRVDRRARFVTTLVALRHADDPEPLVASGRWDAEILAAPRGTGGFGYDALVYLPALGVSVAELDAGLRNSQSHRAVAARTMLVLMREVWGVADRRG